MFYSFTLSAVQRSECILTQLRRAVPWLSLTPMFKLKMYIGRRVTFDTGWSSTSNSLIADLNKQIESRCAILGPVSALWQRILDGWIHNRRRMIEQHVGQSWPSNPCEYKYERTGTSQYLFIRTLFPDTSATPRDKRYRCYFKQCKPNQVHA